MNLSSSTIAIIVVLLVAGFAIGNFMGAKPKPNQVRSAELRLLARGLRLYPKLVPTPSWLPYDKPMVTQYTLIIDELSLPMACYVAEAGVWRLLDGAVNDRPKVLHQANIALPDSLLSLVLGLQIKANSITIFWQDEQYQYSKQALKLDKILAQADLQALKVALTRWAEQI